MLHARRCAVGQQKPSALQIGQALQFLEQVGFSLEAASGVSTDEVGVTDGHAESNESVPSRGQVAAPNVRAEGGYAGWCVPTCCVVDSCLAQVRFDAGTSLDLAGDNAKQRCRTFRDCHDVKVIQERREVLASAQRCAGGDQRVVLSQRVETRRERVTLLDSFGLRDLVPSSGVVPPEVGGRTRT